MKKLYLLLALAYAVPTISINTGFRFTLGNINIGSEKCYNNNVIIGNGNFINGKRVYTSSNNYVIGSGNKITKDTVITGKINKITSKIPCEIEVSENAKFNTIQTTLDDNIVKLVSITLKNKHLIAP